MSDIREVIHRIRTRLGTRMVLGLDRKELLVLLDAAEPKERTRRQCRQCSNCGDRSETNEDGIVCHHLSAYVSGDTKDARCWIPDTRKRTIKPGDTNGSG